jgi:hypothetical protein
MADDAALAGRLAVWARLRVTDEEAEHLAAAYRSIERGLAAFPVDELKHVEPPLRSVPGPGSTAS